MGDLTIREDFLTRSDPDLNTFGSGSSLNGEELLGTNVSQRFLGISGFPETQQVLLEPFYSDYSSLTSQNILASENRSNAPRASINSSHLFSSIGTGSLSSDWHNPEHQPSDDLHSGHVRVAQEVSELCNHQNVQTHLIDTCGEIVPTFSSIAENRGQEITTFPTQQHECTYASTWIQQRTLPECCLQQHECCLHQHEFRLKQHECCPLQVNSLTVNSSTESLGRPHVAPGDSQHLHSSHGRRSLESSNPCGIQKSFIATKFPQETSELHNIDCLPNAQNEDCTSIQDKESSMMTRKSGACSHEFCVTGPPQSLPLKPCREAEEGCELSQCLGSTHTITEGNEPALAADFVETTLHTHKPPPHPPEYTASMYGDGNLTGAHTTDLMATGQNASPIQDLHEQGSTSEAAQRATWVDQLRAICTDKITPPFIDQQRALSIVQQRVPFIDQQRVPFIGQQRVPFIDQQRVPFINQQRVPFIDQQRVPFIGQQRALSIIQQRALSIVQQRVPFIDQQRVPFIGQQRALSIIQQRVPFIDQQRVPFIDQQRVPFINQQRVPFIDQQRVPFIDQQRVPFIDQQRVPLIDQQRVPFIHQQRVPFIVQQRVPFIDQQRAMSIDQQRTQYNYQHKAPLIDRQRAPLIDQHRAPLIDQQRAPLIDQHRAPLIDQQRATFIDQHRAPLINQQRAAFIDQHRAPLIDQQRAAFIDQHRAPLIDQQRATFIDQHRAPLIDQQRATFIDQHRASLIDQKRATFIDQHRAPLIDQHRAPLIDQHRAPLIEQDRAPLIDRHENGSLSVSGENLPQELEALQQHLFAIGRQQAGTLRGLQESQLEELQQHLLAIGRQLAGTPRGLQESDQVKETDIDLTESDLGLRQVAPIVFGFPMPDDVDVMHTRDIDLQTMR